MFKNALLLIFTFLLIFSSLVSAETYTVSRVIDGDSIELSNGEQVRYIGIDTPEFHNGVPDPYAQEAYEINKKLVEGKEVRLELDVQKRDKYNRILAYVYVDDLFVNAYLIENGYTQILTIPPDVTYQDLFLSLERKARENKAGLWGLEKPSPKTDDLSQFPYIGNKNTMKFHHSWCPSVDEMNPKNKVYFSSRERAIEAGYIPCKRCHP